MKNTDTTNTITDSLHACIEAARAQGWAGADSEYEHTEEDLDSVAEDLGRKPTSAEWAEAGMAGVGAAHIADEDEGGGLVTLEYMPRYLASSHRAAGGFGSWPLNGAQRVRMDEIDAMDIVEADPDGYAEIISGPGALSAEAPVTLASDIDVAQQAQDVD